MRRIKNLQQYILLPIIVLIVTLSISAINNQTEKKTWSIDDKVIDLLVALGDSIPQHYIKNFDSTLAKKGEELCLTGRTIDTFGNKVNRISKYFLCTDCHNQVQEDPNLAKPHPEERLSYAIEKNIPFLPATTFFGIANREKWYNDDYIYKYGIDSNYTLEMSTQLCATECSQGRKLTDWELKAINHYYYSISYSLRNIKINANELSQINGSILSNKQKINLIKSKYSTASRAHFLNPLNVSERKLGSEGDPQLGKELYNRSCLHCHKVGGVTRFKLSDTKIDLKYLYKRLPRKKINSLYEICRIGTEAKPGYKPYMPKYTSERLSRKQEEHIAAYIKKGAGK